MRVTASPNLPTARPGPAQPSEFVGPAGAPAQCRALARVPHVEPEAAPPSWRHGQPEAAFLAHLIATAQGAPQTRARCRAEPGDACEAYARASERLTSAGDVDALARSHSRIDAS
jgi:hypothetical protein